MMRLILTDRRKALAEEDRDLVNRRLTFAVSRYENAIDTLNVVFSDENGPKGGPDLCCRLTARMRGGETVVVNHKDVDLPTAISHAAERMQRALGRTLEKGKR